MRLIRNVSARRARRLGFSAELAGATLYVLQSGKYAAVLETTINEYPKIGMRMLQYLLQPENPNKKPYWSKQHWIYI